MQVCNTKCMPFCSLFHSCQKSIGNCQALTRRCTTLQSCWSKEWICGMITMPYVHQFWSFCREFTRLDACATSSPMQKCNFFNFFIPFSVPFNQFPARKFNVDFQITEKRGAFSSCIRWSAQKSSSRFSNRSKMVYAKSFYRQTSPKAVSLCLMWNTVNIIKQSYLLL